MINLDISKIKILDNHRVQFYEYIIYDDGKVWSNYKEKFLVPYLNLSGGYQAIDLYIDNHRQKFYVHRLVAQLFIPNPNNFKEVNHKDLNKENNHKNNLEWINHKLNIEHVRKNKIFKEHNGFICIWNNKKYPSIKAAIKDSKGILTNNNYQDYIAKGDLILVQPKQNYLKQYDIQIKIINGNYSCDEMINGKFCTEPPKYWLDLRVDNLTVLGYKCQTHLFSNLKFWIKDDKSPKKELMI